MQNENTTTHILNKQSDTGQPQTATKAPKVLKKRGRKGDKIATAFENIPAEAVNFDEFATRYNVTTNVLRQIKRHDRYKDTGQVFVRKNKTTGIIMIWREAPKPAE